MDDSSSNTKPIDPKDEQIITKLMRFLETYIQRRDLLQKDVHKKRINNFIYYFQSDIVCNVYLLMYILKLYNKIIFSENNFRSILVELEHENASLRYCNSEQKKMVHNYIDNITWKNNNELQQYASF